MVILPYLKLQDGGSFWQFLHSPGNDSRHDVPQFVHWLTIRFADWHPVVESMLCVALGGCAVLMVLRLWERHPGGVWEKRGYAWFSALVLLSPLQWMNWSWGIQICYMLAVTATLASLMTLAHAGRLWHRSLLAVPWMWAAVLSFANGWLAFVLGAAVIVWRWLRGGERGWLAFTIWVAAGGLALFVYTSGGTPGQPPSGGSALGSIAGNPGGASAFFARLVGAPFGEFSVSPDREERVAVQLVASWWVGVISLGLFAVILGRLWKRRQSVDWDRAIPWLTLAIWGLGNAAAITLARLGEGEHAAFHSRYPAFTLWFYIGILGLLFWVRGPVLKWVVRGWMAVLIAGAAIGGIQGWDDARRIGRHVDLLEAAVAFRKVALEPVYLDASWPSADQKALDAMDRVEALGLLHVVTVDSPEVAEAKMSEEPLGMGALKGGRLVEGGIELDGWAVSATGRGPVKAVAISSQTGDAPERWLGLATRNKVLNRQAEKLGARVLEGRIGWVYEPLNGDERAFMRKGLLQLKREPLPAGRTTFRAYIFDPVRGLFSRLPGEAVLDPEETSPPSQS